MKVGARELEIHASSVVTSVSLDLDPKAAVVSRRFGV